MGLAMPPRGRSFRVFASADMRQDHTPTVRCANPGLALPPRTCLVGPLVFDGRDREIPAEGRHGSVPHVPFEGADCARAPIGCKRIRPVPFAGIAKTHHKRRSPKAVVERVEIARDEGLLVARDRFLYFGDDLREVEVEHLRAFASGVRQLKPPLC